MRFLCRCSRRRGSRPELRSCEAGQLPGLPQPTLQVLRPWAWQWCKLAGSPAPAAGSRDTWGTFLEAAAIPPFPQPPPGCLSLPQLLALSSFTFLFAEGWDSLGSGRPGEPQPTRSQQSQPKTRAGCRVAAPGPAARTPWSGNFRT
ncbi:interleukin-15 isoform X2 [Manis pentadactyla]|uniref:interleukin-15 isoform X2 n=1 Tax=Manis pentadactyla TaxID=143292 RepID=UPI00255C291D|nr:interleukin-15 isoform X2 [Manis pentadactyla]XP_057358637.1 interleukin-15 isoform X2 [Manis pentadactyla]